MTKRINCLALHVVPCALALAMVSGVTAPGLAQTRGTGNPTPGTQQPATPNLADRVTLTGCVRAAPATQSRPATDAAGEPSDSRFVLTNAKREGRVPPRAGTSEVAKSATRDTYRLAAIDSALSPFVGTMVEISGQVEPSTSNAASKADEKPPILRVEFIQKLTSSCS